MALKIYRHFISRGHTQPVPAPHRAMHYSCGRGDEKWLMILNCHCMGLANCLCLLTEKVQIDAYVTNEFARECESFRDRLDDYDQILATPSCFDDASMAELDLAGRENVLPVPTLYFDGYHPDSAFVYRAGKVLNGCAGLHSVICFSAYQAGLDERRTAELFNESTYRRLGYFDHWDTARNALFKRFSKHGYDIREAFLRWSRTGPFMHMPNHPQIGCLKDVALMILGRLGITPVSCHALPHDNLANAAAWPIYPELALRLGVPGGYRFKLGGEYTSIDLTEFIARSFAVYRSHEGLSLTPNRRRVAKVLMEVLA